MNEQTAAKLPFHVVGTPGDVMWPDDEMQPGWLVRLGIMLGVLMAAPQPKVWTWNPSVLTLLLLIASMIAGGGYYLGQQDERIRTIQKQADAASAEANTAKTIAITTGGMEPEVTPTPTLKKEKH